MAQKLRTKPSSLRAPFEGYVSPHRRVDVEAIFRTLRFRIVTLHYRPGAALREQDLGEEFGASRTPIRNAIQRLEQAGLVRPVAGKGTIVRPIDLDETRDALDFRIRFAPALQHFVSFERAEAALQTLHAVKQRQRAAGARIGRVLFATLSHDSRSVIEALIVNRFALRAWTDSYYLASRLWFLEFDALKPDILELHIAEVEGLERALTKRDAKMLAREVEEGLRGWRRALEALLPAD